MPSGPVGNGNLGLLRPVSRGRATVRRQLDALFAETIRCGEAARSWFDGPGLAWRAGLLPEAQARAALEQLAISARLLAIMNWLLDPAHGGQPVSLRPLNHGDEPAYGDDHPLAATPGGEIARTSRQLLDRARALAAQHGEK